MVPDLLSGGNLSVGTALQHWYVSVECHDVSSLMALKKNLNVTACVVEIVDFLNCLKALTKATED